MEKNEKPQRLAVITEELCKQVAFFLSKKIQFSTDQVALFVEASQLADAFTKAHVIDQSKATEEGEKSEEPDSDEKEKV